jgi:hypothetical protein
MLAACSLSIIFLNNCTLVVLEQHIVLNLVSLVFHEVLSPADHPHEVISTHDSDSIELRVLSFCLVKLMMGSPLPKDRPPPPCMLGWTANAASTHHFKMLVLLALMISGSMCAPLGYFIW